MVTELLVGPAVEEGARLIRSLESVNMYISAALWVRKYNDPDWKLIIATPRVNEVGPSYVYTEIQKVLRSLQPHLGITLQDVTVISSTDQLVKEIKRQYGKIETPLSPRRLYIGFVKDYDNLVYVYRIR